MAAEDSYDSVLKSRYCTRSPLLKILSERHKTEQIRQLWIWLAEGELALGLTQVTQAAIDEMKAQRNNIDWDTIRSEEKRLKHDVMAHNHAFGKICPKAAGIIHLGATSCYVQDNSELIIQRESLDYLLKKTAICLARLGDFAEQNRAVVTVGRTHLQTASLVTVGKRAALWAQDLLIAFKEIERFRNEMRFRGVKGATGTQDSFMTLFHGDEDKVLALDEFVTKAAGFGDRKFAISGQTYTRLQDVQLLYGLSLLAGAVKKICFDIRFLQSHSELLEPFEKDQIGSSAMPYKKNPMKCERICSLARELMNKVATAQQTHADQGLERTLDDSAVRRVTQPDAFLLCDTILTTLQVVFEGLTVQTAHVQRVVGEELPFLALEKALMWLTELGVDRQQAHEIIRQTAFAAKDIINGGGRVDIRYMLKDEFFAPVRDKVIALASDPIMFTGRAAQQVDRFLADELRPAIAAYPTEKTAVRATLDV